MKITAKFPGTCPVCKQRFAAGTQVEWKKGQKTRHLHCADPQLALELPRGRSRRRGYDDAVVLAYVQEGLGETRDFGPAVDYEELILAEQEDACPF